LFLIIIKLKIIIVMYNKIMLIILYIYILAGKNLNDTDFIKTNLQSCLFKYLFFCSRKHFSFSNVDLNGLFALLLNLIYVSDCIPKRVSARIKIFG